MLQTAKSLLSAVQKGSITMCKQLVAAMWERGIRRRDGHLTGKTLSIVHDGNMNVKNYI